MSFKKWYEQVFKDEPDSQPIPQTEEIQSSRTFIPTSRMGIFESYANDIRSGSYRDIYSRAYENTDRTGEVGPVQGNVGSHGSAGYYNPYPNRYNEPVIIGNEQGVTFSVTVGAGGGTGSTLQGGVAYQANFSRLYDTSSYQAVFRNHFVDYGTPKKKKHKLFKKDPRPSWF